MISESAANPASMALVFLVSWVCGRLNAAWGVGHLAGGGALSTIAFARRLWDVPWRVFSIVSFLARHRSRAGVVNSTPISHRTRTAHQH